MSRRVTVLVLGLILVVVAVGAFLVWPRGTSEVKPEAALKDFRERATSTTAHHDDEDSATKLPASGVYMRTARTSFRWNRQDIVPLGEVDSRRDIVPLFDRSVMLTERGALGVRGRVAPGGCSTPVGR